MKPFLLEEIDEFGSTFGRIVWGEQFDEPVAHLRHAAVLDVVTGRMVMNADDLGSNTAKEMKAAYPGLIAAALEQHKAQTEPMPEVDLSDGETVAAQGGGTGAGDGPP